MAEAPDDVTAWEALPQRDKTDVQVADIRVELEQARALSEKATDGPWVHQSKPAGDVEYGILAKVGILVGSSDGISPADADFIENARSGYTKAAHAVQAVLDRHQPVESSRSAVFPRTYCSCGSNYPCADVRAIIAAWGGQDA